MCTHSAAILPLHFTCLLCSPSRSFHDRLVSWFKCSSSLKGAPSPPDLSKWHGSQLLSITYVPRCTYHHLELFCSLIPLTICLRARTMSQLGRPLSPQCLDSTWPMGDAPSILCINRYGHALQKCKDPGVLVGVSQCLACTTQSV